MEKLAIHGGKKSITKDFDLGATYFKEELNAVSKVIKSNTISGFVANNGPKFLGGSKVIELESLFKSYFNIKFAVASNSATSSLHSALVALDIGKNDEVIVPALSMSASASSILMAGAKPVFVDIKNGICSDCKCKVEDFNNRGCYNIDTSLIEKKINSNTKALLVVHLFGKSCDMDSIRMIAEKYNLKIIEDCAQSPGTKYNDEYVGTLGDIGVFSFNQSKTISAGEGGVAITNDEKLALRLRLMRNHAEAMIESFPEAEMDQMIGFNYRLTELEATVAVEQFKRLDTFNYRKIELSNSLSNSLNGLDGLKTISKISNNENVLFIYPILISEEILGISRDTFVKSCVAEGVPMVSGYTKPLIDLPLFKDFCKDSDFNIVREVNNKKLISLKICHHNNVSNEDIKNVGMAIRKVHEFYTINK